MDLAEYCTGFGMDKTSKGDFSCSTYWVAIDLSLEIGLFCASQLPLVAISQPTSRVSPLLLKDYSSRVTKK